MGTDAGHRDTWSAPAGGWPRFDDNGRVVSGETCGTMAHADRASEGFCICIDPEGHGGCHHCVCYRTWTDESAPSVGKW